MLGIIVGEGRGDGATHVYGANRNNKVYEFRYDSAFPGGRWLTSSMGAAGTNGMNDIVIGKAYNSQDTMCVYGANENNVVYRYTRQGSSALSHKCLIIL
jgi:hypothetical protein